jgi:hypothetical protein
MSKKLTVIAIIFCVAVALVFGSLLAADSTNTAPPKPPKGGGAIPTAAAAEPAKAEAKGEKAAVAKFEYVGDKKCKLCHKAEYDSWATTLHAKAWGSLDSTQQKGDSCSVCHMTGKDAAGVALTGVQCESCHGPGSAYKTQTNMKDRKLAMANGMILPTKEVCVKCHNEKSPTFKGFDFDKYSKDEKGIHKQFPKKAAPGKG